LWTQYIINPQRHAKRNNSDTRLYYTYNLHHITFKYDNETRENDESLKLGP